MSNLGVHFTDDEIQEMMIEARPDSIFRTKYKTSFNRTAYKNATKLSIAIWKLKEANPPIPYQLKFFIAQLARSYTREAQFCFLCAAEKAKIAFADPATTLNFRSEIMSKCLHRRKHLLENWT